MTKEEIARIVSYCEENKVSYRQRLSELGVKPWNFYDAKRKYAPKQDEGNAGEFLQLVPGGPFVPDKRLHDERLVRGHLRETEAAV